MSNFFHFLKLIRSSNLFLIALTQILAQIFILKEDLGTNFLLLIIITLCIALSGYIINDVFDVESDQVNKKNIIIGNYISVRNAMFFYYLFTSVSIFIAIYLFYLNNNFYLFVIFISSIFFLWWYSKRYKHRFIIGNFIVAFLTAICIFNVYLVSINPSGNSLNLILVFSAFSFFSNFAREIIKDLEDLKGDKLMNSKNIASTLNIVQTKQIVFIFLVILSMMTVSLFVFFLVATFWNCSYLLISFMIWFGFIFALLYLSILGIIKSEKKEDYNYLSNMLKLVMLLGVLSIPLIYYVIN